MSNTLKFLQAGTCAVALAAARALLFLLGTSLFGYMCFLFNGWLDVVIANCLWSQDWTLSSLLGPALAVHWTCCAALMLVAGGALTAVLLRLFTHAVPIFGRCCWIGCLLVLLWVLRIPVPIEYSLYYFVAIRY